MARPATDLRHRILVAARAAFDSRGVDAASLRAIARAAGTTIGMIYYYFPTKDELFDAVVDQTYGRFLAQIEATLARPGTLREQICRLGELVVALSEEDKAVVRLVVRDALVSSERRARLFARFRGGHVALLARTVMEARRRGEVDPGAPLALVLYSTAVLGILPQLLLDHLPLPDLPPGPGRVDAALDLLFHGIAGGRDRTGAGAEPGSE